MQADNRRFRAVASLLIVLGLSMIWDTAARSQYSNSTENRTDPRFQSYSSYQRNRSHPGGVPSSPYSVAASPYAVTAAQYGINPSQYTYDRLFYKRPTLSPYLNMSRPSGPYVNNYQSSVKPAIAGREKKANTLTGGTQRVGANSAYYNQWYSQRREMGLAR